MSARPQLPGLGDQLGERYLLKRRLRPGASQEQFRARDRELGIDVALELLPAHELGSAALEQDFLARAQLLEQLRGTPGVISLIRYGRFPEQGWPYLVTALCEGRPLDELAREQDFAGQQLRELCVALAKTLAACHDKGVTHGALRSCAVALTLSPLRVELFDFSQASRTADPKLDVFAFGLLVHELIARRLPPQLDRQTFAARLRRGQLAPAKLDAWGRGVHSDWSELVADCGELEPKRRPDMFELVDRLEHIPLHSDEGESTDRVSIAEIHKRASSDYPGAPGEEDDETTRRVVARSSAAGEIGGDEDDAVPTVRRRKSAPVDDVPRPREAPELTEQLDMSRHLDGAPGPGKAGTSRAGASRAGASRAGVSPADLVSSSLARGGGPRMAKVRSMTAPVDIVFDGSGVPRPRESARNTEPVPAVEQEPAKPSVDLGAWGPPPPGGRPTQAKARAEAKPSPAKRPAPAARSGEIGGEILAKSAEPLAFARADAPRIDWSSAGPAHDDEPEEEVEALSSPRSLPTWLLGTFVVLFIILVGLGLFLLFRSL